MKKTEKKTHASTYTQNGKKVNKSAIVEYCFFCVIKSKLWFDALRQQKKINKKKFTSKWVFHRLSVDQINAEGTQQTTKRRSRKNEVKFFVLLVFIFYLQMDNDYKNDKTKSAAPTKKPTQRLKEAKKKKIITKTNEI